MLISRTSLSKTLDAINAAHFEDRARSVGLWRNLLGGGLDRRDERAANRAVPSALYARRRHELALRMLNRL